MTESTVDGVAKVVDGRNLEPPEPFVQTMDALDAISPGQKVMLILGREDARNLLRRADEALYRAKGEGRNRVCQALAEVE